MKLTALFIAALTILSVNTGYAADVDWEGWSFDYSTRSNSSGLVLTNVSFNGERVLGKMSMPVMRVEYENDICGPYADILSFSKLMPADSGAPNNLCDNQSVCRRSFIQDGEKKFEIGSNWQIGEYQIYQTYYFSERGTIDSRIYSRGLQCVINHSHHAHWMFDFDIGDSENDRILRGDSEVQQLEFNDMTAEVPYWTIEDATRTTRVRLFPSEDDGEPDNFSQWDVAARKFRSNEVGRWRLGARGEIGSSFMRPPERIDGVDLVMWYVSHLSHSASDGASIWHSSGPRIEVITGDAPVTPEPAAPEPDGDNLLVNGGFEAAQSLAGWANCSDASKSQTVSASREGNSALRVFGGGCLFQEVRVTPASNYRLSCDVQRTGNTWTILEFSFLDANYNVLGAKDVQQVKSSGEFKSYNIDATAPADTAYALALVYSEDDTLVDACKLVENTDTSPVGPPEPPAPPADLLSNGGFEDGLDNWNSCAAETLLSQSTDSDSGEGALAVDNGGCIYQEFPVSPGVAYSMKCRAKRTDESLYTSASLTMLDSNYMSLDGQELPVQSTAYENYSISVTAPNDTAFGTVVLYSENPGVFDSCEVLAVQ